MTNCGMGYEKYIKEPGTEKTRGRVVHIGKQQFKISSEEWEGQPGRNVLQAAEANQEKMPEHETA